MQRSVPLFVAVAAALLAAGGCSSDSPSAAAVSPPTSTDAAPTTEAATTSTAEDPPFSIMVTNDDGYDSGGIDAVVESLRKLDGVTVTVTAPAENQSGSGDKTTDGKLKVRSVKTESGYRAKAVEGFPPTPCAGRSTVE